MIYFVFVLIIASALSLVWPPLFFIYLAYVLFVQVMEMFLAS